MRRTFTLVIFLLLSLAYQQSVRAANSSVATNPDDSPEAATQQSTDKHHPLVRREFDERASGMWKSIRDTYATCADKGGTLAVGYCIAEEKIYQGQRLNQVYQTLLGACTPEQRRWLIESQRIWLVFHQNETSLQGAIYGSDPAGNLQVGEHEVLRISERADQLSNYLELLER